MENAKTRSMMTSSWAKTGCSGHWANNLLIIVDMKWVRTGRHREASEGRASTYGFFSLALIPVVIMHADVRRWEEIKLTRT